MPVKQGWIGAHVGIIVVFLLLSIAGCGKAEEPSVHSTPKKETATPAEITELSIAGHHFATEIRGPGGAGSTGIMTSKDPALNRFVVVTLNGKALRDKIELFSQDFLLKFRDQEGNQQRASCDGLGWPGFLFPGGSKMTVKQGPFTLGLAFLIPNNLKEFELYHVGGTTPVTYQVGDQRLYSVLISTNQGREKAAKISQIAQKAGFQVVDVGEKLDKQKRGVEIHHNRQVSNEVEKLAQALKDDLGVTPQTSLMEQKGIVASVYDVAILVGK